MFALQIAPIITIIIKKIIVFGHTMIVKKILFH